MSAEIITLPVIPSRNAPATDSLALVKMEIGLELAIMEKLCVAAAKGHSSVDRMAEALIVWGLAAIEKKSPEQLYESLKDRT